MLSKNNRTMIVLAILVLCAFGYLMAGDHEEIHTLKLEDLADGETRTFGEGDHKVTVTRNGDQLSVNVDGLEGLKGLHGKHVMIGSAGHDIDCDSEKGDCNLWVSEDGNVIKLGAGGIGGNAMFFSDEGDAHGNVIIEAIGDGGDIEKNVHVIRIGEGGPHIVKMIGGMMGHHGSHGDHTVLRCEEGDTTMVLDTDEAEEVFFCPKHKTELKKVAQKIIERKVEVHSDGDDD
ncbi:MAG: hypothetical protein IFK94_13360 [Acidobacteria bacterium]|uniref:Uncharacterized protein n=1 Tax=Candidatus Polarisedimenticola svalbardensis TaxID=2886004 RepID=A0A8J7CF78_9BACT|nr:hypothetical protein [Candidatus Polarisedimenticola svalbardensis]